MIFSAGTKALLQQLVHSGNFKLIVAGEFYTDAQPYWDQITRLGIADKLILKTDFIPDDEVRYYFCAADMVVQQQILSDLSRLIEQGQIKTTLKQSYGTINASNLKQAHALLESGKAVGKIVLSGF